MALTKVTGQVIKNTTDVTVGVLTVTNTLAVGGTVSIGGTLTYEDVTNVDAVGLVTARNGIVVGSGITLSKDGDGFFTGIVTATSFSGSGANLTDVDVVSDTSPQLGGNLDVNTKNILLADSGSASDDRIIFGTGSDLHIYFDGSNSYIKEPNSVAGQLIIDSWNGTDIRQGSTGELMIRAIGGASVELYENGTKVAETTSGGFNVEGVTYSNGLDMDDSHKILLGTDDDLSIYHNGSNGFLKNSTGQQIYRSGTHTFENAAGSTEYARIDSSGNFGINVSTPQKLLDVRGEFAISNSNSSYWDFDRDDSDGSLKIKDTGTERVRITSAGKVNIGDTQMSSNLLNIEDGTAAAIDLASHGSGGDTAYIGVKKSAGGGLTFGISNRDIIFKTGATYSSGTTFDSGNEKLRLLAAGGLTFNGDTATANALDDYEEGTWTPTSNVGAITVATAHYVKIGSLVYFQAYITFPSMSGSAEVQITNFPFDVAGGSDYLSCSVNSDANIGGAQLVGQFNNGGFLVFAKPDNSKATINQMSSKFVLFSCTIMTH